MKVGIFVALALVLVGGAMFTVALALNGWDLSSLSSVKYKTVTHEPSGDFDSIFVQATSADVQILPSEDGNVKVVCTDAENVNYDVSIADGKLTVVRVDARKWYERIGIGFGAPAIKVYLPNEEYSLTVELRTGDVEIPAEISLKNACVTGSTGNVRVSASVSGMLSIDIDTGNVFVFDNAVGALEVSNSTGSISLSKVAVEGDVSLELSTGDTGLADVTCTNLTSTGSTGGIEMENVIASGKMSIKRSTGDVEFYSCDAAEIFMKTTTGDIEGSLLTDKIFMTKSSTGDIEVPRTTSGGVCDITTSTGDIEIEIER